MKYARLASAARITRAVGVFLAIAAFTLIYFNVTTWLHDPKVAQALASYVPAAVPAPPVRSRGGRLTARRVLRDRKSAAEFLAGNFLGGGDVQFLSCEFDPVLGGVVRWSLLDERGRPLREIILPGEPISLAGMEPHLPDAPTAMRTSHMDYLVDHDLRTGMIRARNLKDGTTLWSTLIPELRGRKYAAFVTPPGPETPFLLLICPEAGLFWVIDPDGGILSVQPHSRRASYLVADWLPGNDSLEIGVIHNGGAFRVVSPGGVELLRGRMNTTPVRDNPKRWQLFHDEAGAPLLRADSWPGREPVFYHLDGTVAHVPSNEPSASLWFGVASNARTLEATDERVTIGANEVLLLDGTGLLVDKLARSDEDHWIGLLDAPSNQRTFVGRMLQDQRTGAVSTELRELEVSDK